MEEYRRYTKPAELSKAVNMLRGMVAGMETDQQISEAEERELLHWCSLHENLRDRHPFRELLPLVDSILLEKSVSPEDREDIVWLCESLEEDTDCSDMAKASLQYLDGLVHGIMADGTLSDKEILAIKEWTDDNDFLMGSYPFDEISSLLHTILTDKVITEEERGTLTAFLSNLIEFKDSYNLREPDFEKMRAQYSVQGVCAFCPDVVFEGRTFVFTGESYKGTRQELEAVITRLGGVCRAGVSKKTDYLIVGNAGNPCWVYACYGRKIGQAIQLRKEGARVQIVNETDFWDAAYDAGYEE